MGAKLEKQNKTILVVDDDADLRDALEWYLNHLGFQVLSAEGGNEALPMVREQNVDLVLSDIQMPNGDGVHLLKNVIVLGKAAPPVILISAYSEMDEKRAIEAGALAFFAKPLNLDALNSTIHGAIG